MARNGKKATKAKKPAAAPAYESDDSASSDSDFESLEIPAPHQRGSSSTSEDEEASESAPETDSGACEVVPMLCSLLRKGAIVMIRNRPCKVVEMSVSKTGKHGHAKCHFVGIDVITGKKLDARCTTSDNVEVPASVEKSDYRVTRIIDDRNVEVTSALAPSASFAAQAAPAVVKRVFVNVSTREEIESRLSTGGALVTVISVLGENGIVTVRQLPAATAGRR